MYLNPVWKRVIAIITSLNIVSVSFAGELSLPTDKRWLMVASRATYEEAKQVADYYKQYYKGTAIFYTPNGKDNHPWYPITIGYVPYPAGNATLNKLISDGVIPSDSYLASGNKFTTLSSSNQTATPSTQNSASNSDGVAALVGLLAIGAVLYAIGSNSSSSDSDESSGSDESNANAWVSNPLDRGTYCQTTNPLDRQTYCQTTNPLDRDTYRQNTNPLDRKTYTQTTNPLDRETYRQGTNPFDR